MLLSRTILFIPPCLRLNSMESPFKDHIIFADRRKKAVALENKRRYCGLNIHSKQLFMHKVDGGLISDPSGNKCDFLLLSSDETNHSAYFIELKGADFLHAVDQILSTYHELKNNLEDYNLNGRVVLTKIHAPDLSNSKLDRLRKILKQHHGTFLKAERNLEEVI